MSIGTPKKEIAYFRPTADGRIVRKITEEEYNVRSQNPQDFVRRREWAAGDKSGVSFEEVYSIVSGNIISIAFREHDEYGRSVELVLQNEDGDQGVFAVQSGSSYGLSLLEVLPNVDLGEPVQISAWSKEKDGKTRKSIFVSQNEGQDNNVKSAFRTWSEKKKEWKISKGYPEVNEKDQKKYGKKYWTTRYFPEVEVFLVEYITDKVIPKLPKIETPSTEEKKDSDSDDDEEDF